MSRRDTLITLGLIAPRVLRLLWPRMFVLDPAYLDAAARVAGGERPFRDFVQPQTPLVEWVTGGLERVLGTTSYRVSEILTALIALAASILLWRLASRRLGATAGALAALIFAWNPLLMLLHVVCREVWVTAAALGCCLVSAPLAIAGIAALGFFVKPTFAVFAGALLLARPRAGVWACLGCLVAFGACLLLFGRPFWVQTFLYAALKGRTMSLPRQALQVVLILPALIPAALLGVRRDRLFAAWLGAEIVFYVFVSKTLWEHNLIELLAPAAACAAAGLVALRTPAARVAVGACAAALFIAGPLLQGSKAWTGLAGSPRAELRAAASQLKQAAPPGTLVLAPLEIAAEANRRTPIHYPELEGLVRMADRASAEGHFGALVAQSRAIPYVAMHELGRNEWRSEIDRDIAEGRVRAAVIDPTQFDSPLRTLQTFGLSTDDLVRRGFHVIAQIERYTVLAR